MSESSPRPGGSGGASGDADSQLDEIQVEDPRPGPAATATPPPPPQYEIGQASQNINARDSVAYSHNWFSPTEVEGVPYAVCRTCEAEESRSDGTSRTGSRKVKKKSKLLKTVGGSTKGLFTHMQAHHPNEYNKMMEQNVVIEKMRQDKADRKRKRGDGTMQLKLISNNNNNLTVDNKLDPRLQSRWDAAVVEYVSESGVSFAACQKLDILLRAIWPVGRLRINVRDATTVSRHMNDRSIQLKMDVYSIINASRTNTKAFSFTTDLWKSRANDSYMALTCHYINEDYELVKLVPFVQYFGTNRHTGKNIKVFIDQFMEVLGLGDGSEYQTYIVCDNASNNKVMVELSCGLHEYYCALHTMALCVKAIFQLEILTIRVQVCMFKCREISNYVRRSENHKNELKQACKDKEIGFILPKKPIDVRWNSAEANVSSILRLKPALQHLAANDGTLEWSSRVPNAAEFEVLESLVKLLTQIKITCKKWEGEKEPTIQAIIPELWNIKDVLERKINAKERYVSSFAKELKKLIISRFKNWGTDNLLTSVAHYLDPEFQGLILKQFRGAFIRTRDEIKKLAAKYDVQADGPPQEQIVRTDPEEIVNLHLTAAQRLKLTQSQTTDDTEESGDGIRSRIEVELDRYDAMKISQFANILMFWKQNKDIFPLLSNVAREILSIPASSASSERVFSVGSMVCSARRSNLLPDKVADLMLLKLNSKTVESIKANKSIEPTYTASQIKNLINVEFEDNEDDDPTEEVEYIEDIEDNDDDDNNENRVTLVDVEDMIDAI